MGAPLLPMVHLGRSRAITFSCVLSVLRCVTRVIKEGTRGTWILYRAFGDSLICIVDGNLCNKHDYIVLHQLAYKDINKY